MITCLAPWVHLHIGVDGIQHPCCVSNKEFVFNSPEEMNKLRKTFLKGQIPNGICDNCFGSSANRVESERYYKRFYELYSQFENEIIQKTNRKTGETSFEPVDFDVRTSLCNLSCRTCDSSHSTKIAADEKNIIYMKPVKLENSLINKFQKVKKIYWAGGEPLLNPFHWMVMNELSNDTSFQLVYNTNCCVPETYWNKFVQMINNHKGHIGVYCSSDGFNEIGEFIRPGFKTELYKTRVLNLKKLDNISRTESNRVFIDFTSTNLGLFALKDLLIFCINNNIPITLKNLIISHKNFYLSINLLKPESFNQVIEDILETVRNDSIVSNHVKDFCNFLKQQYVYTPWSKSHEHALKYSLVTKCQSLSDFPEVIRILDNHIR